MKKQELQAEVDCLREDAHEHAEEITWLEREHEREVEDAEASHKQELREVERDHEDEVADMESSLAQYERRLEGLKAQKHRQQEAYVSCHAPTTMIASPHAGSVVKMHVISMCAGCNPCLLNVCSICTNKHCAQRFQCYSSVTRLLGIHPAVDDMCTDMTACRLGVGLRC